MVEHNIDDDAGVAPIGWLELLFGLTDQVMIVGIAINLTVKIDTVQPRPVVLVDESSLDEIAQQRAGQAVVMFGRKIKVSQEIQRLASQWSTNRNRNSGLSAMLKPDEW